MKGWRIVAVVAVLALLVGAKTAWAAFVTEGTYTVGNDPYTLNAADFNGDGRPDVATINGSGNSVSVFLRQPGGGFAEEPGSPVAIGQGPSAAATGDFNGDGRTDLAVTNFVDGTVSVLLRQAGGGFAPGPGSPIAVGARVSAIVAGDFAGDGHLDLAVAENDNARLTILVGDGNSFSPQIRLGTGATPSGIAVGDFNGDGAADLAVANRGDGTATILLRSGGGYLAEGAVPVGSDAVGVAAADFNGDGRADLAVPDYKPGTVSVLLRRPSNDGFAAEPPIAVASPAGIASADFDRDGRPDLAVTSNSGGVQVLRRTAGAGFTADPFIALADSVNGVALADFDRDGRPDIAVSAYRNDRPADAFSVLLNPAPAGPPPTPTPTPTPLPAPVAGKTVNVQPEGGKVLLRRPGSSRFVVLSGDAQIPVGATIDTREGRIGITVAQGQGRTASADFYDGVFKLTQSAGAKPVTTLTLTEKLSCPRGAAAAAKKPKSRRLWGDGSGSFRTRGQYSAATVRGTKWLTQDTCTSTLTRVSRGAVTVQDFVKHKTVIVRAGKRYTARAKRR